jgi:hypothetical protein
MSVQERNPIIPARGSSWAVYLYWMKLPLVAEEATTGSYRTSLIWLPKRAAIKGAWRWRLLAAQEANTRCSGSRPLSLLHFRSSNYSREKESVPSEVVLVTGPLHRPSSTAYHGHEMFKHWNLLKNAQTVLNRLYRSQKSPWEWMGTTNNHCARGNIISFQIWYISKSLLYLRNMPSFALEHLTFS